LVTTYLSNTLNDIGATLNEINDLEQIESPTADQIARLNLLRQELQSRLLTNQALSGLLPSDESNKLTVLRTATEASQIAPRTFYYSMLAAVVGLLLAGALAAVVEFLEDRVRDSRRVEEITGVPILGAIRRKPRLSLGDRYRLPLIRAPGSHNAEAYRSVRTKIELAMAQAPIRALMVSSAEATEGKSLTAVNLAITFAQAGRRVVLMDADLRQPRVHTLLRLPNNEGLSNLLRMDHLDPVDLMATTKVENLRVLTTGPIPLDPAALLSSDRMRALIVGLNTGVDLIVVDTPSLEVADDALILSALTDAAVLVVDVGRGKAAPLRKTCDALVSGGVRVLGTVIHGAGNGVFSTDFTRRAASPHRTKHATKRVDAV
jgi:capsular exopolysaccharide synthesis family protein